MADILIRGMEMPKGNEAVTITIFPNGKVSLAHDRRFAEYAEAVPVPDHGRLIDADALGEFPFNMDFCDGGEADEWVRNAPTIIPASEEVYDKYTDSAGNFHWTGTKSGAHIIPAEEG